MLMPRIRERTANLRARAARCLLPLGMLALGACTQAPSAGVLGGDPASGREAFRQYACHVCHTAPGVTGAVGHVGPPLAGIAGRKYLAGVVRNTPENMLRWIRRPREIDPLTAMPDMGVSEEHGRDIVAFLYTLKE